MVKKVVLKSEVRDEDVEAVVAAARKQLPTWELEVQAEPEYYDAHIIYVNEDGREAPWTGHTNSTREGAINDAQAAIGMVNLDGPDDEKFKRIEVFSCSLVETVELNP